MIAGIYLILPFIQKICVDEKVIPYFLGLWILNEFILPLMPWAEGVTSKFGLHFPVGYVGYFVLGYYLSQLDLKKKERIAIYIIGVLSFIFTIIASIYASNKINGRVDTYFGNFTFNVLFMTIAFFTFIKYCGVFKSNKFIQNISKSTLIVYLLHPFFLDKMNVIGIHAAMANPWIMIPALVIGVFIVCTVIGLAFHFVVGRIIKLMRKEKS